MTTEEVLVYSNTKNPFPNSLGMELTELSLDQASAVIRPTDAMCNPRGYLSGGLYFTLADFAATALARADGGQYVTQDGSIHYVRGVHPSPIRALAACLHRGKTTCLVRVDITDEENTLLTSGTFTFFRVGTL